VLGDAAYGVDTDFRTALTALSLSYVLGVQSTLGVWPPGSGPLPPKPWSGKGRRPKLQRRDDAHQPVSAKDLAFTLPASAWQTVSWREGSQGELSGRFAAVRVRPSHRDYWRSEPHPEEWLLIEWPEGDKEPGKYWLSTLPATTALVAIPRWLQDTMSQSCRFVTSQNAIASAGLKSGLSLFSGANIHSDSTIVRSTPAGVSK